MIVSSSQQTLIKADFFFSSPARKGHASYCYHLASIVCHPSKDIYTFDISIKNTDPTLTKLGQKVLGVSSRNYVQQVSEPSIMDVVSRNRNTYFRHLL